MCVWGFSLHFLCAFVGMWVSVVLLFESVCRFSASLFSSVCVCMVWSAHASFRHQRALLMILPYNPPPLLHLYKQTPTARPSPRRVRWSRTWATGINTPPAFIRLKTLLASLLCSFWSAFWFSRDLEVLFKSRPESRQIKTSLREEFSAFLSIKYKHLRYARQMVQHKTQPLSGLFYCPSLLFFHPTVYKTNQ